MFEVALAPQVPITVALPLAPIQGVRPASSRETKNPDWSMVQLYCEAVERPQGRFLSVVPLYCEAVERQSGQFRGSNHALETNVWK